MHKRFFIVLFLSLCCFTFVLAQESDFVTVSVPVDASNINTAAANLDMIDVSFCEVPGQKEVSYFVRPGEKRKLCLTLTNTADVPVPVTIAFVDAIVTSDEWQHDACQTEDRENIFPNYVKGYDRNIILEPGSEQVIYPILSLPKEVLTGVRACLVYYLQPTELGGNLNFSVLMRRAKFIDIQLLDPVEWKLGDYWGLFVGIILGVLFLFVMKKRKK